MATYATAKKGVAKPPQPPKPAQPPKPPTASAAPPPSLPKPAPAASAGPVPSAGNPPAAAPPGKAPYPELEPALAKSDWGIESGPLAASNKPLTLKELCEQDPDIKLTESIMNIMLSPECSEADYKRLLQLLSASSDHYEHVDPTTLSIATSWWFKSKKKKPRTNCTIKDPNGCVLAHVSC
jgi:hypothetical protein